MSNPSVAHAPRHRRSLPVYIGSGFLAVAGHYAVTIAAVEGLAAPPLAASAAGFCVGAVIKYLCNYFLAFRSDARHATALARFAVMLGVMFGLNALCFASLQQGLGLHYLVAQLLTTGLLIPPGYVLSRRWVFGAARGAGQARC
jgi:putative flippase GtrA